MKRMHGEFLKNIAKKLSLIIICLAFAGTMNAQCDPLTNPILFGLSQTFIFCNTLGFGVSNSDPDQVYYFSMYRNGVENSRGGPLDGNGGQLSVAAYMRSAQDAGEYRVTTRDTCNASGSVSFYAFYGNIDNLSISSWGSNSVTFKWASCGPAPAVTYEYAVTTESNPSSGLITYLTTTDTSASAAGLNAGETYYIHIRVNNVFFNGFDVGQYFQDCSGNDLPWQTIRFISCAGPADVGLISPSNAIACFNGTTLLAATGGASYQWYNGNNVQIPGANTSTYIASSAGEYKVYITTNAGCEGMAATATIIQDSLRVASFFGGGCYNIGDTVKMGIFKTVVGQTYIILKDGMPVDTLTGIGRAYESGDTLWFTFQYSSVAQAGNYTVSTTTPFCSAISFGNQLVSGTGLWIGAVSSDWLNAANWTCGALPDANTDVIISSAAINFPVINSNVSCRSLVLQPGATITVTPGFNLDVTGQ